MLEVRVRSVSEGVSLGRVFPCLCLCLTSACSRPEPSFAQDDDATEMYAENSVRPPVRARLARATDPGLTTGILANGVTYYVLELPEPVREVAVWLGVDVGSTLEAEAQRGYAHFVEHLAFSGTTNFPADSMSAFLQRSGMTLGSDINAFTSTDATVYKFMVPPDDPEVLLTSLKALRDVSTDLTFAPEAVAHERKVILEELRQKERPTESTEAQERSLILAGTAYADRDPIGVVATLQTATAAKLRAFYEKWYTPSRMAVVVVGDDRVRGTAEQIQELFGTIPPAPPDSVYPTPAPPPIARTQVIVTQSQTEARPHLHIASRSRKPSLASTADAKARLVEEICNTLLVRRLSEVSDEPGSAVVSAELHSYAATRQMHVRKLDVAFFPSVSTAGVRRVAMELERIRHFGYLASEIEVAVQSQRVRSLRSLNRWAHASPERRANELLRNYFEGERVSGAAADTSEAIAILHNLRPEDFDGCAVLDSEKAVVSLTTTRWEKRPSVKDVTAALDESFHLTDKSLKRWQPKGTARLAFDALPVTEETASIVGTHRDTELAADVWTLDNGVRVILKQTQQEPQTIRIEARQAGGWGGLEDFDSAHIQASVSLLRGIGTETFSTPKLLRVLNAEDSTLRMGFSEHARWFTAVTHERALPVVLKAIALQLTTDPYGGKGVTLNYDWLRRSLIPLADTEFALATRIAQVTREQGPLGASLTVEQVEQLDLQRLRTIWKALYSDYNGLTIAIIGDFSPERLRPLAERYFGALPGHLGKGDPLPIVPPPPVPSVHEVVSSNVAQSQVWMSFTGKQTPSENARRDAQIFQHLLELRLFSALREATGNVYAMNVTWWPPELLPNHRFDVFFSAAPANVASLQSNVLEQITQLATVGPTEEELLRTREALRRQVAASKDRNDAWLRAVLDQYAYGLDTSQRFDVEATLARVTQAHVQQTAATLVVDGLQSDIVLNPNR